MTKLRKRKEVNKPHNIKSCISDETNELLRRAAKIQDRSLSNFVERSIVDYSRRVIAEAERAQQAQVPQL